MLELERIGEGEGGPGGRSPEVKVKSAKRAIGHAGYQSVPAGTTRSAFGVLDL